VKKKIRKTRKRIKEGEGVGGEGGGGEEEKGG